MSNQIFRRTVPFLFLHDLLEEICLKTDKYYLVDYNAYKKFMYDQKKKDDFLKSIKGCYHASKQMYVTREMTYNNFLTVIRQIARSHNLEYNSQIRYNESNYNIVYFIPISSPDP